MDKRTKRLNEFESWLEVFSTITAEKYPDTFILIDNAAILLNEVYWQLAEKYIRPIIGEDEMVNGQSGDESKISRFKIISAIELTIVDVQPFLATNESSTKTEKELNAEFAWFVGYSILVDFSEIPIDESVLQFVQQYKEKIPGIDVDKITPILKEHLTWLAQIEPDVQLPIISNAQTWRLFYLCLLGIQGNIKPN